MVSLPRTSKPLAVAGAALASVLVLSSCSTGSDAAAESGDGLKVVATTTQLTDFAGQIGGDDIELTGLLTPGGSAHHFDPSPADLLALGEADVLIVNGAELETFVDDAVEASGFAGEIVTAADGIDLDEATEITVAGAEAGHDDAHDHADEADAHDHAEDDHADEDHDHAEDVHDHAEDDHADEEDHAHDHDHGDLNPHIWTAPRLAEGMATEVAEGLAAADPEHADAFTERGEAYVEQLHELDAWVGEQFANVPEADRVLVTGHDSLRYYLHDYDIRFAGSILPSFEDNAEPSAAEIDELVDAINDSGVKAIFVESSQSPKLAETIADETDAEVVSSDTLFTDSLGASDSDGATYIDATVHNTRVIIEAWGGEAGELPDSLQE